MKIAKKVLALAMAVALVACFAVMAFAAPAGAKLSFTAGEPNAKGLVEVKVNAVNCTGLTSFDITLTADNGAALVKIADTADGEAAKKADNAFTSEFNKANGQYSGYFKNNLWSTADFTKAAEDLYEELPATFSAENFGLGVLTVKVNDGATTLSVKGTAKFADGSELAAINETVKIGQAAATEAPTQAPTTAAPSTKAPATQAPTTAAPVKQPPTGDNSIIAVAAGVVILAGAALLITKKRK